MTYKTEQEMREIEYVGKSFSGNLNEALQKAQEFARDSYVASLPQLIEKRIELLNRGISLRELRKRKITAFSEESVGKSPVGNPLLVIVHGGGILSTPERVKNCTFERIREYEPLNPRFQYSQEEWKNLLDGKLSNGSEIPIFSSNEFLKGNLTLPDIYGVVLDLRELIKRQNRRRELYKIADKNYSWWGYHPEVFLDDLLFNVRVGGIKQSYNLINAVQREVRSLTNTFYDYDKIDLDKPQGTFLELGSIGGGYYHDEGDIAYYNLWSNQQNHGNFVGVARKALDSLEQVSAQDAERKLVDRVLKDTKPYVPEIIWSDFEFHLRNHLPN